MILWVVNKTIFEENDIYNFVYSSRKKALDAWKALFNENEIDNRGYGPEDSFRLGDALFDAYSLRLQSIFLDEKL